uniref:ORF51 n=1 Tax=Nitrosopumilaceae spindle-shaped virus TaxID=3065433 RepID=A0AAT9J9I2_9VIRU
MKDSQTKVTKCNRCELGFNSINEMVIVRPLYPISKAFTEYYHATCYNYNRYKILPKNYPSTLGNSC